MLECNFARRDFPPFIRLRIHAIHCDPVEVVSDDAFILRPVTRQRRAHVERRHAVALEFWNFPDHAVPLARLEILHDMSGHRIQCAVRSAFAIETQLERIDLHCGRMDIHPKRNPIEAAPVLRRVEIEPHLRAATLLRGERAVLLVGAKIRFIAHGSLKAQRPLTILGSLAGIRHLADSRHGPIAVGLHVVHNHRVIDRLGNVAGIEGVFIRRFNQRPSRPG